MSTKNKSLQTFSNKEIAQKKGDDIVLTPELEKALISYLPDNFLPKVREIKTVRQALSGNHSTVSKIKKSIGTTRTEALVKVYLVRLNELLDLKRPLSENAIDEIANILVSDYYNLTMTDIVFVLQEAIKGKYGAMFESLSIPKVIKWFEDYFHERCNTAEQMSNEERSQFNSNFGAERSMDRMNEQKEFSKQYALQKLKEKYNKS